MWSSPIFAASLSLLASGWAVHAQSSLWIPGLDPQPMSAGVLGVGNDGRTTWALQQGTLSGTFTDSADFGFFPGTVTMVEGPNDAVYSAAVTDDGGGAPFAVAVSCTISNGVAACVNTVTEGTVVSTGSASETVSPFEIQGGGAVSGSSGSTPVAPVATSAPASGSQTQSSSGSQASAGSSPASSGAQATGTAGGSNTAGRNEVAGGLLFLGFMGNAIYNML